MFRLSDVNEFETEVEVQTPVEREYVVWSFFARFRILTDDMMKDGYGNILKDALIGVKEFKGIELPQEATPEQLLALVKGRPDARNAMVAKYKVAVEKKNLGGSLLI